MTPKLPTDSWRKVMAGMQEALKLHWVQHKRVQCSPGKLNWCSQLFLSDFNFQFMVSRTEQQDSNKASVMIPRSKRCAPAWRCLWADIAALFPQSLLLHTASTLSSSVYVPTKGIYFLRLACNSPECFILPSFVLICQNLASKTWLW